MIATKFKFYKDFFATAGNCYVSFPLANPKTICGGAFGALGSLQRSIGGAPYLAFTWRRSLTVYKEGVVDLYCRPGNDRKRGLSG
jgi:hypothetical protein